ncbi:hypothetical protein SDC9_194755 [bioreactor metagenome]|uniref:Uncharacterized protein n=1 Tax=bioreactor metagenome TaxID=1076179 RepID=A0A645I754_9ZZZZ
MCVIDALDPRHPPQALQRRHHKILKAIYHAAALLAHLDGIDEGIQHRHRAGILALRIVWIALPPNGDETRRRHRDQARPGLWSVQVLELLFHIKGHGGNLLFRTIGKQWVSDWEAMGKQWRSNRKEAARSREEAA